MYKNNFLTANLSAKLSSSFPQEIFKDEETTFFFQLHCPKESSSSVDVVKTEFRVRYRKVRANKAEIEEQGEKFKTLKFFPEFGHFKVSFV